MMTPDRWAPVEQQYHEALTRGATERGAFLADACDGDETLRREVESLLEHDGSAAAFLSTPAAVQTGPTTLSGVSLIGITAHTCDPDQDLGRGKVEADLRN